MMEKRGVRVAIIEKVSRGCSRRLGVYDFPFWRLREKETGCKQRPSLCIRSWYLPKVELEWVGFSEFVRISRRRGSVDELLFLVLPVLPQRLKLFLAHRHSCTRETNPQCKERMQSTSIDAEGKPEHELTQILGVLRVLCNKDEIHYARVIQGAMKVDFQLHQRNFLSGDDYNFLMSLVVSRQTSFIPLLLMTPVISILQVLE